MRIGAVLYNDRLDVGTIVITPAPKLVDLWLDGKGNLCARWENPSPKKCAVIVNAKPPKGRRVK